MDFDYETAAEAMMAYGMKMKEALAEEDMKKYKKAVLSALRCCHTTLVYMDDSDSSECKIKERTT